MATDRFFQESTSQSLVKSAIVTKYFDAWSQVMIPRVKKHRILKLGYLDLFSGPGFYEDGTESTPIIILKKAIQNSDLQQMLITLFNDGDSAHAEQLSEAIQKVPGIETLKYTPQVSSYDVNSGFVSAFQQIKMAPSLIFIDPWGYKGLSLDLLSSLTKDWGCDCFFFFNFNRINPAINNSKVSPHMEALFGPQRAEDLRQKLIDLDPNERRLAILEEISQALKDSVGQYVLPFEFRDNRGSRTKHHLIFVSKHSLGYTIAKDIMARESSSFIQGVPSFQYTPASTRQPLLFQLSRPLDELAENLLQDFAGQKLSMEEIFEQHHIGTQYIKPNYKDALRQLEVEQKIMVVPPADQRPKRKGQVTFADSVIVRFLE